MDEGSGGRDNSAWLGTHRVACSSEEIRPSRIELSLSSCIELTVNVAVRRYRRSVWACQDFDILRPVSRRQTPGRRSFRLQVKAEVKPGLRLFTVDWSLPEEFLDKKHRYVQTLCDLNQKMKHPHREDD
ncbi:hypothetical protein EYF80_011897 [Liparis tanakae]|uniref:Uncharacterized protein n=1 Tax=Liparis tanakae TaxID=230148 RepID=A0A4Z2IIK8_9TELE|nr:hypothetical protein EYF80_011897 [Liparis tanakae]